MSPGAFSGVENRRIEPFRQFSAPWHHTFSPFKRGIHRLMRGVFSQIVIGVIVTVIGTVIANAVVGNGRHHFMPGSHFSGSRR